ncbi:hypothetical protein SUGI_0597890 [Cryptomeria japonica]|nr:hypothetical protein SUGI_0597890 [Cryptomeria japonica]
MGKIEDSDGDGANGGKLPENDEEKKPKQRKPKKPKESYGNAPNVQLKRFADYFASAFVAVNLAQFRNNKILKESTVAKLAEPSEALKEFMLWALGACLARCSHSSARPQRIKKTQLVAVKGAIAIFVILAMLLRKRPDLLLQLSSTIKIEPQFQGQDKVYMIDCLGHHTGVKWKLVKQVVKDVFQTLDVGCGQIKCRRTES